MINPNPSFSDICHMIIEMWMIVRLLTASNKCKYFIAIMSLLALRLMFFAGNRSHAILLFISANVLTLNILYFETVCSLVHDISTNSAPQNICDILIVHLTFIHITLDFLMLVIYMLINLDWELKLICFPFSEPTCGIAWILTCVNLRKNLSKIKFINFYLQYLVMRMIKFEMFKNSLIIHEPNSLSKHR